MYFNNRKIYINFVNTSLPVRTIFGVIYNEFYTENIFLKKFLRISLESGHFLSTNFKVIVYASNTCNFFIFLVRNYSLLMCLIKKRYFLQLQSTIFGIIDCYIYFFKGKQFHLTPDKFYSNNLLVHFKSYLIRCCFFNIIVISIITVYIQ